VIYLLDQLRVLTPGVYRRLVVEADTEGDARQAADAYAIAKEDATAGTWLTADGATATAYDGSNNGGILLSTTEAG